MPYIEKHAPGAFCWIELATTVQNAAKSFYASLFGWSVSDMPIGPTDVYTIFRLEGRDAAAGCTLRPDQKGVPPYWMIYIAVASADASAKRAAELGGKVLGPPFDVMDAGRMAIVQDPAGATFCLWQANKNTGIGIAGVDGTLCWADLSTPDQQGARSFYSQLFGWKLEKAEPDTSGYLHITNGAVGIGGVPPASQRNPKAPPHWLAYFLVSDCDRTAAKAKELGATLHAPPTTIEHVGRWSVVADPQGAVFAIFQTARK